MAYIIIKNLHLIGSHLQPCFVLCGSKLRFIISPANTRSLYFKRRDVPKMSTEEVEELEDDISMNFDNYSMKASIETEKMMRKTSLKTIGRKYFKKPQEVNLLTWDAKEQIRFLHNEDPDIWTIQKLAESFPASEEGIIRLLKSKFRPRNLEEWIKHDKQVQKRWKELTDGKSGPKASRPEHLLASGQLDKLQWASGNPMLPTPEESYIPQSTPLVAITSGTFTNIVKDYCESKQAESDNKAAATTDLVCLQNENRHLLNKCLGVTELPKDKTASYQAMFKFRYANMDENNEEEIDKQVRIIKKSRQQEAQEMDKSIPKEQRRNRINRHHTDVEQPSSEMGEFEDSYYASSKPRTEHLDSNRGKFKKYVDSSIEAIVDTNRKGYKEVYMHDNSMGYQYPKGRVEGGISVKSPEELRKMNKSNGLYRDGKDYYDDDGEFLYRAP